VTAWILEALKRDHPVTLLTLRLVPQAGLTTTEPGGTA